MRELINFCFKGGERQFIIVTKFCPTWSNNNNTFKICFDKASFKLAIYFLNFGSFFFRKTTGIPLGSDPTLL